MLAPRFVLASAGLLVVLGACADETSGGDAGDDTPDAGDADGAPADGGCGSEHLPAAQIVDTEGLAMAPDGTLYYSQTGAIGRRRPGMAPEDAWVTVAGVGTIYGLAHDDTGGALWFAVPTSGGGGIYRIDTQSATPAAEEVVASAPGANGLVIGPDGAVYYSSLGGGDVFRVAPGASTGTKVTASKIPGGPNGIYFQDASTLIVLAYNGGDVYALTLLGGSEQSRSKVGAAGVAPDGIARDAQGRWYIGDNGAGRLLRYQADWSGEEILLDNVPAAANVVFGRGAIDCRDVIVASSDELGVYAMP
jgi:sugar lactone lactonase YvrE